MTGPAPFWLVIVGLVTLLLALSICWAVLPWAAAMMATITAFLGMEVGMAGARWTDEQEPPR